MTMRETGRGIAARKVAADLHAVAQEAAQTAAQEAVHSIFKLLGVDLTKPEEIENFRADLAYAKRLRRLSDQGAMLTFRIVVAAVVIAVLLALATNVPGLKFLRLGVDAVTQ